MAGLLSQLGLKHLVLCPGSRNAPLIRAFGSHSELHCYSIVDERSAAYVALGMARELGEAVGVVVTSGTAVLNLAPAVAEAYHQQLPLVVFSADRPLERIAQFNNQVIDQTEAFLPHSKGFCELPVELETEEEAAEVLQILALMIGTAMEGEKGPVHFNVLLGEPLYQDIPLARPVPDGLQLPEEAFLRGGEEALVPELEEGHANSRKMILVGAGSPDPELEEALAGLKRQWAAVVVAEHLANQPAGGFVHHPELLLTALDEEAAWEALAPDLLITLGGQVLSRSLKLRLLAREGLQVWEIGRDDLLALWAREKKGAVNAGPGLQEWQKKWAEAEAAALERSTALCNSLAFSNFTAMAAIHRKLPASTVLHLGNSATVRYALYNELNPGVRYYANRGTSGIDGCVSSAVGAAQVSKEKHLLVLGDLSFVYDSNALWNRVFPKNLSIIVLNDGEGGIFRLLQGPAEMPGFEEFQLASHPVSLEGLSRAYGRSCLKAASLSELSEALDHLLEPSTEGLVLELDTTACENSLIFDSYKQLLKQANS